MLSQKNLPLLGILLITLALSGLSRYAQSRAVQLDRAQGWVTTDPDSLYHMRRVDRALTEGWPVAETDELLNHPEGSAIPWPPYYTYLSSALLSPFADEEPESRRALVEQGVGSLALLFGVLTTLMACLAGQVIAGRAGALVAGSYHALCQVAIAYGKLGNGDHHSFVSFLSGALLLLFTLTLCGDRLRSRKSSLLLGSSAGLLAGLLLGSWVGGMMLLIQLELVLGWLLLRQSKDGRDGLGEFGLSFHVVAGLVLTPAVLASPWTDVQTWMVVNLSFFHLAFLTLGGAVFVPLFFIPRGARGLRIYPWIVAATLGALAAILLLSDLEVARAVREGFDWASRTNEFMAGIRESRSLFAADASPTASQTLGLGLWVLPIAWLGATWSCFRRGEIKLLPWVVCVPLLVLQTAQQARFAESLVLPMAVLLGWGAACLHGWKSLSPLGHLGTFLRGLPGLVVALAALLIVGLCNATSTMNSLERLSQGKPSPIEAEGPAKVAVIQMLNWLGKNSSATADDGVLATWGHGHAIEWRAQLPSVATNFGSYVGEEGFLFPAQFFMSEDPARARAMLADRGVRYVLVTSQLPDHLGSMIDMAAPEQRDRWVEPGEEGKIKRAWFETMGARLMFDGAVYLQDTIPPLGFLRLVNISPIPDQARRLRTPTDVSPAAWLWEHVKGAQVEAYGEPGTTLYVSMTINFPRAKRLVKWQSSAIANERGRAVVRVPYSTQSSNKQCRVMRSNWRFGNFTGDLELTESAVRNGARLLVHGNP